MPGLNLKEIAAAIEGTVTGPGGNPTFSHFHFDTRQITGEGTLFFALKTQANDGHRYVRQLQSREGIGAVVSLDYEAVNLTIPLIRVKDTLKAAQQLAFYTRGKYRDIKYIGITGSAGKTTTKEFVYQLLSYKARAFRSFQNWNNSIGMPFSLLNLTGEEEAAVFELAMSEPGIGEIDVLARILRPDAAVILNVFPVHLEYLENLDNVAQAKSEILNYLSSDDAAFINGDSEPLMKRIKAPENRHLYGKGRKIFFGRGDHNDIRLKEIIRLMDNDKGQDGQPITGGLKIKEKNRIGDAGEYKIRPYNEFPVEGRGEPRVHPKYPDSLVSKSQAGQPMETRMLIDFYGMEASFETPLVNRVHLENLFVAIVVAQHLGMKNIEIQEAIRSLTPLSNRGEITRLDRLTIINETYNSNPEALKKTLEWVNLEYGKKENRIKIAVLGDMLELGERELEFHREVGRFFAGLGFDRLITVGKRALSLAEEARSAGFDVQHIHTFDEAVEAGKFLEKMTAGDEFFSRESEIILLFKASRGIQLEKALQEL